jgi:PEP-CTERM motif-containing protein
MSIQRRLSCALAAIALAATGAANAIPIVTNHNLGTIDAGGNAFIGQEFTHSGDYIDKFNFTFADPGSLLGLVQVFDNKFVDIDLNSISLFSGGKLLGSQGFEFAFDNLLAGVAYSLVIDVDVTSKFSNVFAKAEYKGKAFNDGTPPPTDVPEPGSFALAGVSLLALSVLMRRRLFG